MIFSLIFALNALGIGGGSAIAIRFKSLKIAMLFGAILMTVASIIQYVCINAIGSFLSYEATMLFTVLGLGLVFSSVTTLAMNEGRKLPGSASAIFGAIGFLFGGLVSPLVGIGNILNTSNLLIIICAIVCLTLSFVSFRRKNSL